MRVGGALEGRFRRRLDDRGSREERPSDAGVGRHETYERQARSRENARRPFRRPTRVDVAGEHEAAHERGTDRRDREQRQPSPVDEHEAGQEPREGERRSREHERMLFEQRERERRKRAERDRDERHLPVRERGHGDAEGDGDGGAKNGLADRIERGERPEGGGEAESGEGAAEHRFQYATARSAFLRSLAPISRAAGAAAAGGKANVPL